MNTRQIIIDSAFNLFSKKRLSKITVQEILDQAKCSRFSFYKYFDDKFELMRLYYTSFVDELVLNQYNGRNYPEIQAQIFQFVLDREPYFQNVNSLEGPESFWTFLSSYASAFFSSVKCENDNVTALSAQDRVTLMFIVEGAVSVFKDFARNSGENFSPRQISTLLCRLYPSDYYELSKGGIEGFRKRFAAARDCR